MDIKDQLNHRVSMELKDNQTTKNAEGINQIKVTEEVKQHMARCSRMGYDNQADTMNNNIKVVLEPRAQVMAALQIARVTTKSSLAISER